MPKIKPVNSFWINPQTWIKTTSLRPATVLPSSCVR